MIKMKRQAGFTLIELILVIVILGILAAFALPRFADLGGDARRAVVQGASGSIKSASAIAHAAWLAAGDNTATTIDLDGTSIGLANGYPASTAAGIQAAAQIATADFQVAIPNATTIEFRPNGVAAASTTCLVSFVAAPANGSPDITFDVSDCG